MSISVSDSSILPSYDPVGVIGSSSPIAISQPPPTEASAVQTSSSIVSLSPEALRLSSTPSPIIYVTLRPINTLATSPVIRIDATPLRLISLDTTAPTVTKFTPADGATGAATNANIALTFSEAIKRGTGAIVLKNAAGTVIESFDAATSSRITIASNGLTINPTNELAANTQYFVTFAAGSVKDLAGNSYAGSTTYDFTTGLDTAAPTVTSFTPGDGSTGAATNANIGLTFSEAIKRGVGSIVLKNAAGTVIEKFDAATSTKITIASNGLTLNPTNDLAANTQYFVTFAAGSVKDVTGNNYAGTTTYDFKTAPGNFNIDLVYSGDATYKSYFDQAKAMWEKVIIGDLPSVIGIDDLKISAVVKSIDGPYNTLGQGSPTLVRSDSYLPLEGSMSFDIADMAIMIANGTLLKVVMHEMGHVLGLGSLWGHFGFNSTVGQYTGAKGVAMYRQMSGNASASFVPLETTGGDGTKNVHWSEAVFDKELMTGYSESTAAMPLSKLTIAALADLGYQVSYAAADAYALA